MDGLSIKQNVDSAPTVFASDFDICLAGCHGNGASLLPDGQIVSIVAGQDIPTVAANELVISVIYHVNPPRFCLFLSAVCLLGMDFSSIRKSRLDSHKFHPDQATHRSMDMNSKDTSHSPLRFPDDSRSTPKIKCYAPGAAVPIFGHDGGQGLRFPRRRLLGLVRGGAM